LRICLLLQTQTQTQMQMQTQMRKDKRKRKRKRKRKCAKASGLTQGQEAAFAWQPAIPLKFGRAFSAFQKPRLVVGGWRLEVGGKAQC